MSDIKNDSLSDAVLLPHTEELLKVFPYRTPDELTFKRVEKELMDKLHLSIGAVGALLGVHYHQRGALIDAMMLLFGLSASELERYLIAITGDINGCQQLITEIRLPNTTDITLSVHIGYLGIKKPHETDDVTFIRIRDHVTAAFTEIEIIDINPVVEGVFKPNIVELINAYFQYIKDLTKNVFFITNAPGGGAKISTSYQQIQCYNDHVFQFMVRFNFNPDIVKLKVNTSIQDNVVSFKPEEI